MKVSSFNPTPLRANRSGFTMVELLMALGASALLLGAVVIIVSYTAMTFSMMGNYVDLDRKSLNAVDMLSRELRNSSSLVAFSTNNPQYLIFTNSTAGTATTLTYNSTAKTLVVARTGQTTRTNLTGCTEWSFSLYSRVPNINSGNITFYPCTNSSGAIDPAMCKLVNLSWTCVRTVLGTKLNTESIITAQIVLRNKVY